MNKSQRENGNKTSLRREKSKCTSINKRNGSVQRNDNEIPFFLMDKNR